MAIFVDPHSFARPTEARVTHVGLDLVVDFERRVLRGTATLDLDLPGLPEEYRTGLDDGFRLVDNPLGAIEAQTELDHAQVLAPVVGHHGGHTVHGAGYLVHAG